MKSQRPRERIFQLFNKRTSWNLSQAAGPQSLYRNHDAPAIDPVYDLMFLEALLTKDGWKSLLGKMRPELRMTEFNALIPWVGNSIRNILLNTYSVPGTIMKGLREKRQIRLSLCLKSSQCRKTFYNTCQRD